MPVLLALTLLREEVGVFVMTLLQITWAQANQFVLICQNAHLAAGLLLEKLLVPTSPDARHGIGLIEIALIPEHQDTVLLIYRTASQEP